MSEEAVFIKVARRFRDEALNMITEEKRRLDGPDGGDPLTIRSLELIAQVMDGAARNMEEKLKENPERN